MVHRNMNVKIYCAMHNILAQGGFQARPTASDIAMLSA